MKKTVVLLFTFIAVTSCAPRKNSGVAARNGANVGIDNTVNIGNQSCASAALGMIYNNSLSPQVFETRVKDFLSATINPNEVGSIGSGNNSGVTFSGVFKFDTAGNIQTSGTQLVFTITDSFALQGGYDIYGNPYKPITVKFEQSSGAQFSGQWNRQNNSVNVTIQDSYGTVQLQGSVDAQYFSGTMSFQNTQHVLGSAPLQGTLAQFRIARCGFFQ